MVQPNVKLFEKVSTETQTYMIFFLYFFSFVLQRQWNHFVKGGIRFEEAYSLKGQIDLKGGPEHTVLQI